MKKIIAIVLAALMMFTLMAPATAVTIPEEVTEKVSAMVPAEVTEKVNIAESTVRIATRIASLFFDVLHIVFSS